MVNENARQKLRVYEFEYHAFTAEFVRFGFGRIQKSNRTTVPLCNVKDELGFIVASHLWAKNAKPFIEARLNNGDMVQFRGFVVRYKKGPNGRNYRFHYLSPDTRHKCIR